MKPDLDKIDDAVLALLYFTGFTEGKGRLAVTRAWKNHDWDALDRLHRRNHPLEFRKTASLLFCVLCAFLRLLALD
jgi:hypothetical protein